MSSSVSDDEKDVIHKQNWEKYSSWVNSKLRQMEFDNKMDKSRFIEQNEMIIDMISNIDEKVMDVYKKIASNETDIAQLKELLKPITKHNE